MASTGDIEFCFTGESLHSDSSLVQIVIGPASEVSFFHMKLMNQFCIPFQ